MVVWATVVSGLIIAVGVVGTIVPALPGSVVVVAGVVLFAMFTGWDAWAVVVVATAAVLAVAGIVAGVRIPATATSRSAGRRSLRIGIVGGIVGFFVVPVIGLPLGWVTGVFLSEAATSGPATARASTAATVRSFGKAALVQFVVALAIALMWAVWAVTELF